MGQWIDVVAPWARANNAVVVLILCGCHPCRWSTERPLASLPALAPPRAIQPERDLPRWPALSELGYDGPSLPASEDLLAEEARLIGLAKSGAEEVLARLAFVELRLAREDLLAGRSEVALRVAKHFDLLIQAFPRTARIGSYRGYSGWLHLLAGDATTPALGDQTVIERYVDGWRVLGTPEAARGCDELASVVADSHAMDATLFAEAAVGCAKSDKSPGALVLTRLAGNDVSLLSELVAAYDKAGRYDESERVLVHMRELVSGVMRVNVSVALSRIALYHRDPELALRYLVGAGVGDSKFIYILGMHAYNVWDDTGNERYLRAARESLNEYVRRSNATYRHEAEALLQVMNSERPRTSAKSARSILSEEFVPPHDPDVRRCLESDRAQPSDSRVLIVRLLINSDGDVLASEVLATSHQNGESLRSCVSASSRQWKFPERRDGRATLLEQIYYVGASPQ